MSMTDGAAPAATSSESLSFDDAVGLLNQPPQEDESATPPEDGEEGAAHEESAPEGEDAGPDEEAPGETETDDEAEEPPITPPRTWTKAEKEAFALLPREHQQAIVDRESERDSYYQRGLQEAAAKAKAAEAKAAEADKARQQYESALPTLYARLQGDFQAKFADIKTPQDVEVMRLNDPMRWMEYKDARDTLWSTYNEAQAAQQRQQQEEMQRFAGYVSEQDAEFLKKRPEFADAEKATKLQSEVAAMLTDDYGFSTEELQQHWSGRPTTLRDHRWQLVVADALAYRKAKAAAKTATKKPVPPVQRPGAAPAKGEAAAVTLKILDEKLTRSGRIDDAVAFLNAKDKARKRA